MTQTAEELIELARIEERTELDLSGLQLTSLPSTIASLRQLRVLKLGRKLTQSSGINRIRELPSWLGQLTNLETLDLNGNELTQLPDHLGQLTNLRVLNLSANHQLELPDCLGRLTNIQYLDLSQNGLTELPEIIGSLSYLEDLDISNNELTELPESLSRLSALRFLDISRNLFKGKLRVLGQLKNLSHLNLERNLLTAIPESIGRLKNLLLLNLCNNDLIDLPNIIGQLTNLLILDLSFNRLRGLPDVIGNLTSLQILNISSNDLKTLPKSLGQLTNLESLHLSSLKLSGPAINVLSDRLGQLSNLRDLTLSNNHLTNLPNGLGQLSNLSRLNLSSNHLTDLPSDLVQLTNLESLDLEGNQFAELPEILRQLAHLKYINIGHNKVNKLPNWLSDPLSIPQLTSLIVIGNQISVPPPESMGNSLTHPFVSANIDSIREYFIEINRNGSVKFFEAKLLIIGEGGAGKTSLERKILDPNCQLPHSSESTEGIKISSWKFPIPASRTFEAFNNTYAVNIWDFGGQEIYFSTHQFFLTKSSVYLLVADTRQQHTDFYEWLRMQETFGADSPVLLLKNRNRNRGNSFFIENITQLRERFPNLREPIEVDLTKVPNDSGWNKLLTNIQELLLELPDVDVPRPRTWVGVRQSVHRDNRSVISRVEFDEICKQEGINRESDIVKIAEYLHNLGDILFFHEDPILRDIVILKPTWGLDAVYMVLDNRKIEENLGVFTYEDIRQLWGKSQYQNHHIQLLRIMENFQLCYSLPNQKDTYIAPQLLGEETPPYNWEDQDNLLLRYTYPVFMPRGILSRAIVKLHSIIEQQRLVWRSGVILRDQYARAELLELRSEKQIRIRVSGSNKRDLLMRVVTALDELHFGFPKLRFDKLVPCNCESCWNHSHPYFFELEELRQRTANSKRTIECKKAPNYATVDIESLLDDSGLTEPKTQDKTRSPVNIEIHNLHGFTINHTIHLTDSDKTIPTGITENEESELDDLTKQKSAIERLLLKISKIIRYASAAIYIICCTALCNAAAIKIRTIGWEKFEPVSYIVGLGISLAMPIISCLQPDRLSPFALERKVFERLRKVMIGYTRFQSERYNFLQKRKTGITQEEVTTEEPSMSWLITALIFTAIFVWWAIQRGVEITSKSEDVTSSAAGKDSPDSALMGNLGTKRSLPTERSTNGSNMLVTDKEKGAKPAGINADLALPGKVR